MTDLEHAWLQAEAKAQKLQADKDAALTKVRDQYNTKVAKAVDEAAAAQKAYLDDQVIQSLLDRIDPDAPDPDAERARIQAQAAALGLTLPD